MSTGTQTAEATGARKSAGNESQFAGRPRVLFELPPNPDAVIGGITHAEPSWLTLLAAGAAGMPLRQARLAQARKQPDGNFARIANPALEPRDRPGTPDLAPPK